VGEFVLGPYHPWLREPLVVRLDLHGETVGGAELEPGYNRRGVEHLLGQATWEGALALAGRLCESCTVANLLAFCQAVEELAGLTAPLRGQYLRLVLAELERARSHLATCAALLSTLGVPGPAPARLRTAAGQLLAAQAEWTGTRRAPLTYGGIAPTADILDAERTTLITVLAEAERVLAPLAQQVLRQRGLTGRLVGLASIRPASAERLDLRGPVGRAAGLAYDLRRDAPGPVYARLQADEAPPLPAPPATLPERESGDRLEGAELVGSARVLVVTQRGGDAYARLTVRLLEALESLRLARVALETLPGGAVGLAGAARADELVAQALDRRGVVRGDVMGRAEGPRGEVTCIVVGSAEGPHLVHFHTGSFATLPAVGPALTGVALADMPVALLSFDLCLACAER
jgi:membrane-bound hydrogenase subunit alpha